MNMGMEIEAIAVALHGEDDAGDDIDIDDAGGILHVFQVLRNAVTGRPTHPYDIHEILLAHQGIDPGYQLLV
jgi:hypothetical protein